MIHWLRLPTLVLMLGIGWTSSNFSFIESIACWHKGKKKILVVGDHHGLLSEDTIQKNLIFSFFNRLAKGKHTANVILEQQPEETMQGNIPLDCLCYLSRYAYDHTLKKGSLSFVLSDIRRTIPGLQHIAEVYALLNCYTQDAREFMGDILQNSKEPLTHKKMLEDLKTIQQMVKQSTSMVMQETTSKRIRAFFKNIEEGLIAHYHSVEAFFKEYAQEGILTLQKKEYKYPAGTVLGSFFQAIEKGTLSKDELATIIDTYMMPIIGDLANAMFMKDLIESQKNSAITLVFVGTYHAVTINGLLHDLGYTLTRNYGEIFEWNNTSTPLSNKHVRRSFGAFLKSA
jgi:hypothetical protein